MPGLFPVGAAAQLYRFFRTQYVPAIPVSKSCPESSASDTLHDEYFGIFLALTLRAVASNGELAETVLANGLDFRIGSHSASD